MQLMLNYKKNSFPVSASFSEIQSNSSAALKWFVLPVSPLVDGLNLLLVWMVYWELWEKYALVGMWSLLALQVLWAIFYILLLSTHKSQNNLYTVSWPKCYLESSTPLGSFYFSSIYLNCNHSLPLTLQIGSNLIMIILPARKYQHRRCLWLSRNVILVYWRISVHWLFHFQCNKTKNSVTSHSAPNPKVSAAQNTYLKVKPSNP